MSEEMQEDLLVHEMHYDKSGLNLKLGGQTAKVFLSTLVDLFKVNGGKNFLTITIHQNDIKYAITIQNCNGEDTPSEKFERYEKALKSTESYIFANSLIPVKQREDLQRIIVPALNG